MHDFFYFFRDNLCYVLRTVDQEVLEVGHATFYDGLEFSRAFCDELPGQREFLTERLPVDADDLVSLDGT
ncbi:hypothetical protein AB0C81_19270 [Streptomyces roseoverticillatus]|uniref:hypothetical protein n=1 Tax=Streptomyces roseoverticillatus TaxID=66429 RepID=UPI0033FFA839